MAWDANEKGNYAYLTKTASEHGGVDNSLMIFIMKATRKGMNTV